LTGGGLDEQIHNRAGPELQEVLRNQYPKGCETGEAIITPGFFSHAKCIIRIVCTYKVLLSVADIISAVGPKIARGRNLTKEEAQLLLKAYENALSYTISHNDIRTIASFLDAFDISLIRHFPACRLGSPIMLQKMLLNWFASSSWNGCRKTISTYVY
jgi:hypothetical protein